MIEWANVGREILARHEDIDPFQRAVMLSQTETSKQFTSSSGYSEGGNRYSSRGSGSYGGKS